MYAWKFILFLIAYICGVVTNLIHSLDLIDEKEYFYMHVFIIMSPYATFLIPICFMYGVHVIEYRTYK